MPVIFATSTIIAQAFGMLELSPPSSFGDDSPQARDAMLHYPSALDMCLDWTDWSFASRMASLPAVALPDNVPADPDLPHTYSLPGDCVTFREVKVAGARYRLDETVLRCDQPAPLLVRYTRRLEKEASLPATFRASVALQLAVLLSPTWLGVDAKRARLLQQLDETQRRASKGDARTASPEPYGDERAQDWVGMALR
jgi:hypothetical protein